MDGLESFILENVDPDIREAYGTLFSTEDDVEFDLTMERINAFIKDQGAAASGKTLESIKWSPQVAALKANSTTPGQLLSDVLE